MQPKTLKDLNLKYRDRKKVEKWLQKWLMLFLEQADFREGNVYRANFIIPDFFFFTDCKDLMRDDPESTGQERSLKVRTRKRNVFLQLFVRTLLGEKLGKKIKCSHCGYDDVYINSYDGGHFTYCKECGKTDICTYPNAYNTLDFVMAISDVKAQLQEKFDVGEIPLENLLLAKERLDRRIAERQKK